MAQEVNSTLKNVSSVLYEDDEDMTEPVDIAKKIFFGVLLFSIIFFAISGNVLVCAAICTDRKLRKLGNLFLVSLAVADLLVSSIVMTFAVINDLMGYWMFGQKFCEVWMSLDVMCSTASILNLCAISLDRFIHIRNPLKYETLMTRKVVYLLIFMVWFLSIFISVLPMNLGWHAPPEGELTEVASSDPNRPICALDFSPTYAIVSSCISFYIPMIVMVSLYARLYIYAQKHVRSIRSQPRPVVSNYNNDGKKSNSSPNHNGYHVSDHKAAITLGIIMGVFLICFVPFFVTNIVHALCKTCVSVLLWQILTWLGYFNSMLNPIIYSIFNTEFRDAFKRILTDSKCCENRRHKHNRKSKDFCCFVCCTKPKRCTTGPPSTCNDNSNTATVNFQDSSMKLVVDKTENQGTFL